METSPNILLLMSDEHRADVAGFAGNEVIRTPVLDRLAETGVVFRNAYCPSPICVPSRMAMMTGQLPQTNGCEINGRRLTAGAMTFARRFSQHAYATVACGKLHHTGCDQLQGWLHRIGDGVKMNARYVADRNAAAYARYGRTFRDYKWSDAKEVKRAGPGRAAHTVSDAYTVQGALHYIEQHFVDPYYDRQRPQQPLLLKVSLIQPHYPYTADADTFGYYLNRAAPYLEQPVFDHPFLSQRQVRPGVDASERELRRATAAYYAMVETIDTHYGRVLAALERVGQDLDDWIIIYCSDHGEMLGEHGIWEKQKFFEASVRVPLIVRWPRRFAGGTVIDHNVNLCDLFATLCELAALPAPAGLDSRSLVPLMDAKTSDWRNETVSQFHGKNLMIKWDDLKYQYYGEEMPEVLFDLERDPGETVNLINDARYAAAVAAFRARRGELRFGPNADPQYVNAGYSHT